MSFDALNISSVHDVTPTTSSQPARATAKTAAAQSASESVTVDTMPSSPPPEVLDAIGAAARAYDRLTANGVQLHFQVDGETGKVAVHVYDTQGSVLGSLAPSQVLDLATSGAFE
jgi:uncharacterized protein YlxW (UPF0749 family)